MDDIRKALIAASRGHESRSVGKMELCQAPLLGGLAIGLRTVARVEPLFKPFDDDPHKEMVGKLFMLALGVTREFIGGKEIDRGELDILVHDMEKVANRVMKSGRMIGRAAYELLLGVQYAMDGDGVMAASSSATAIMMSIEEVPMRPVEEVEEMRKLASGQFLDLGSDEMRDAVADDYEKMMALRLGAFPERGQPVDPMLKGPIGTLWPNGPPKWYINSTREDPPSS